MKMKSKVKIELKRILSMLLTIAMLGGMMPASVSAAEFQEDELLGGMMEETTEENVEEDFAQELEAQQVYANSIPSEIPEGETYTLESDITLESGQWFENIAGTLDGNGYTITLTDKPLANNVTGTIQNLGVTSENTIESAKTFGSMAVTFSGTIQNCFSTVNLNLTGILDEVAGLIGTANGGLVQNSYFAGTVKGALSGYGGFIAKNTTDATQVRNCCYENKANNTASPVWGNQPLTVENVEKKSLEEFKSGAANGILNTDIPDLGFSWEIPEDGSNQGFPILVKGGTVLPEKPDKSSLEALIHECQSIEQEGYTVESWQSFSDALAQAEVVFNNEDATKNDVTEATDRLQNARDSLKKEKPAEPVAPPEDTSKIQHISTAIDLKKIENSQNQYYVLDNDIVLNGSYFSLVDFKGVLDGQGHRIIFENARWMFQHLGEDGILQNIHFTGTINPLDSNGNGPVGQGFKGSIINCSTDVKGNNVFGFAKYMKGGNISNSISLCNGTKGALIGKYETGTIRNSYWLDADTEVSIPQEALVNSSVKTEAEMKSKDFVALLNKNRGAYGTKWGQSSNGYPYFGEDQEYNPNKPDFPENLYDVVFLPKNGNEMPIENQTFTVSLDEVDASHIAGSFQLKNITETDTVTWAVSEVKPENCMMIGADQGLLRVDGKGTGTVTATVTTQDGEQKPVAWVKVVVTENKLEEIKLYIDGKDVTNENVSVSGSEEKKIEVRARYEGNTEFVPANGTRFHYEPDDSGLIHHMKGSSVFRFKKPGTASMTVTSKTDETIKAQVKITSKYVPVESVQPALSGTEVIHGRNANDPEHYAFLPNYSGVIVSPENASYADNWKVSSSDSSIAEYVDSMVKGYVSYQAGTVTFTATITQTDPDTKKTSTVSGTSDVTYVYKNPLAEVTASQDKINMENFSEKLLELNFKGEKSGEGWSVTYPELAWNYDTEGIVKIYKKEIGTWKKDDQWKDDPDYGQFVTSDQYYVKALKEGTVTATGIPLDKSNDVKPVKITFEVSGGVTPEVDIDELVNKGLNGAKEHLYEINRDQNYQCIEHDWIVYDLLRAKENIPEEKLETYYKSVVNTVKDWKENKKPTEVERVALVLSVMNKDITNVGGVNLAEMIYNHPGLDAGSNEAAWALLALDAKKTQIPSDAKWSRGKLISVLLSFQNAENGGFGLNDNKKTGVDTTAMALQALAPYRHTNVLAKRAIDAGIMYLKNTMSDTYDMGTSEATAQLLLTLAVLQINPLDSEFGNSYSNTITSLMEYYCDTEAGKGFCHDKANKKRNDMASVQAFQALTAYVQFKNGEKSYWDLSENYQEITANIVEQIIADIPEINLLTLQDEPVLLEINKIYQQLSDDEKGKVKNFDKLEDALKKIEELKSLGEEKGMVSLKIMDGIKREKGVFITVEDAKAVKGMILDVQVPIYENDSMMSIIKRSCEQAAIDISIRQGNYIESLDGLSEFDRGAQSGWMGTLDGIFPNKSFSECTVKDGEVKNQSVLTVEYTENLGEDLKENAEVKTPGIQGGSLKEEFERSRHEYTLTTENKEISFAPEFFNRYSSAYLKVNEENYGVNQKIPVEDEMKIILVSEKTVRGTDRKEYVFTVEKTSEENEAVDIVINLINKIGDKITLDSKKEIQEARAAYNKLTAEQKKRVTNYDKLTSAEEKLKKLEEEQKNPGTPEPERPNPEPEEEDGKQHILTNKKYGITLKGKGLTEDMEFVVTPIGKDDKDVHAMRKEIPASKSLIRLYNVKLLKNGKKTNLPFKSVLTVPVGKKYNGKELTLLHCVDGKIEKLQGKVQDELLSVEVSTLGSIGVVVDTPENIGGSTENTNGNNTTESGQPGSAAKTADETQVEILLMLCIVSSLAVYTILRKKSKKL